MVFSNEKLFTLFCTDICKRVDLVCTLHTDSTIFEFQTALNGAFNNDWTGFKCIGWELGRDFSKNLCHKWIFWNIHQFQRIIYKCYNGRRASIFYNTETLWHPKVKVVISHCRLVLMSLNRTLYVNIVVKSSTIKWRLWLRFRQIRWTHAE